MPRPGGGCVGNVRRTSTGGAATVLLLRDWLNFLYHSGNGVGFPLVVGGLGLMFFGWRMWKISVMLSYGVIGALACRWWLGPDDAGLMDVLASGAALALLSYWPVNYTVSFLGGFAAAGVTVLYLKAIGFSGFAPWGASAAAFIMGSAFAYLNRQTVVILATAILGAVLLVSGLTSWIMAWPQVYTALRGLALDSTIMVPFLLLAPTIASCFYQGAEVSRLGVEL